jgi:hypothetical protein
MGLLYRCREDVEGRKDAELMQRIARLDPLEAVAVERAQQQAQEAAAAQEAQQEGAIDG